MFGRADPKVIILIMLIAIILAVTVALAYFYLLTRPEYPEGTYSVTVEDKVVLVESDPKLAVRIISTPVPEQEIVAPVEPLPPENTGETETNTDSGTGDGEPTAVPPVDTAIPVQPLPATLPPPTPTPRPNQVIIENYQVVQGDTLYGITTKRNTSISLMARYGISARKLVPGTFISLPIANPAYCPGNFPYVVLEEDTLSTIAIKCRTTVATLKEINGFSDNYRLDVTDVICVPNQP